MRNMIIVIAFLFTISACQSTSEERKDRAAVAAATAAGAALLAIEVVLSQPDVSDAAKAKLQAGQKVISGALLAYENAAGSEDKAARRKALTKAILAAAVYRASLRVAK